MKKRVTAAIVTLGAFIGWWVFPLQVSTHTAPDEIKPRRQVLTLTPTPSATAKDQVKGPRAVEVVKPPSPSAASKSTPPDKPAKALQAERQDEQLPLEESVEPTTSTLITRDTQVHMASRENSPPFIVEEEYQRLLTLINQWPLTVGEPTQLKLNISNLFDDPDNDLLATRISLNLSGMSLSGGPILTISGTPASTSNPSLTISARESAQFEENWISARFALPLHDRLAHAQHPLEGDILYRLETTHELNGQFTLYEVVYCQAFQFTQQEVYFAASNNKTSCPTESQLQKIGSYYLDGDKLIMASQLSSLDADQIWALKHQYSSNVSPEVSNYLVAVDNGRQFESYTMQKSRAEMERRLTAVTGQKQFQLTKFDYLLPLPDDQYLPIEVGNYLYDYGHQVVGPNSETVDSDLNLVAPQHNLSCAQIAKWYQMDVVGGLGEYGIDIISSSDRTIPDHNVECVEFQSNSVTGRISIAFDGAYTPYDKFAEGEIYSYILRPYPQYAERLEELKINMTYRSTP
ncbi:hypothetical protein H4F20_17635 [Vibrio sp. 16]|uniref:hypothetical protein n=1 Tax=Vibrio sp. 16 TaxID=391586 RepID=UPI002FEE94EF